MALHAGFAAALSISEDAAQAVLHAAYLNNLIPAIFKGTTNQGATKITYDMVLAEPKLKILVQHETDVIVGIELLGTLEFFAPGKPKITDVVHVRADARMPVIMMTDSGGQLRFGLDAMALVIVPGSNSSKRVSGPDPAPVYGIDLNQSYVSYFALQSAIQAKPEQLVLTPPQLPQFTALKYALALTVKNSDKSLNLGVDVVGVTAGDATKLVDLNRISTEKGLTKVLHEAWHSYDDEYGMSYYETVWNETIKRTTGPHDTATAISLHKTILADVYHRLGRHAVIAAFEQQKYDAIIDRLQSLRGKKKTYEPTTAALTAIDALEVTLHNDYLLIKGVGSNYSSIAVHVDFELKLRFIRTEIDGDALSLIGYKNSHGINVETFDVDIDQPAWVTAIEVIIGAVGVLLAPVTSGISLFAAVVLETVIGSIVGSLLSEGEGQIAAGVLNAVAGLDDPITFTLPGTEGPELAITPDDFMVKSTGITAWFGLSQTRKRAWVHIAGHKSAKVAPVMSDSWPAANLSKIRVVFEDGGEIYNKADPRIRIKWQVHANQLGILILDEDVEINTAGAKDIWIDHASNANVGYNKFIVLCRVYRPWDDWTQEIFAQELHISILDRLDRTHPYVRWENTVHYLGYSAKVGDPDRKFTGWQTVDRKSHIHYTDPKKRCRFADAFAADVEPIYLDELPFPIGLADQHRKVICPYCFFGGPDKHVLK